MAEEVEPQHCAGDGEYCAERRCDVASCMEKGGNGFIRQTACGNVTRLGPLS
jgi:hypothetical protein